MDDTRTARGTTSYRSPDRNLVWSFRNSRDNWKKKYQDLKREHKRLQNQLRDVRKSREQWRQQAEAKAPSVEVPDTARTPTIIVPNEDKKKG
jgi:hypothetical protein